MTALGGVVSESQEVYLHFVWEPWLPLAWSKLVCISYFKHLLNGDGDWEECCDLQSCNQAGMSYPKVAGESLNYPRDDIRVWANAGADS